MLQPGLVHTLHYRVPAHRTVPHLYPESPHFAAMPAVFATGYMVGLLEWACMEALAPHLGPGERSVGTAISVTHCAATPPGMEVRAEVHCMEVEGRRSRWEVRAWDEHELIGEGTHERYVIDLPRFEQRLQAKRMKGAQP